MKKLLLFVLVIISISLGACSGSVGNTDISNYRPPVAKYRLINDNTAYELVSIEEYYVGQFIVETRYNDPTNSYGYLPVISIADKALANQHAVFIIIILDNILYLGDNVFEGWKEYQTVFFAIDNNSAKTEPYIFKEKWNQSSQARVHWDPKWEDFGIRIDDFIDETFIPIY